MRRRGLGAANTVLMNKALLLVLPLFSACPTLAAGFDPFAGPKPLAVLIQSDPWAMVIGSDTPRVAIYENGRVIFVQRSGRTAS